MVADIRRVVASTAGSGDNRNAASDKAPSGLVIIQASHASDADGLGIEQSLAACHGGTGIVIWKFGPPFEGVEDRGIKRTPGWILKGRVLGCYTAYERVCHAG